MDNFIEYYIPPADGATSNGSWLNLIDRYIAMLDMRTGNDTDNLDYTKLKAMLMEYKMLLSETAADTLNGKK